MNSRLTLALCLGTTFLGNACTQSNSSTVAPTIVDSRHAGRAKALAYLRSEGIMAHDTKLESAEWGEETGKWLVILKHRDGQVSHWFVNEAANDYSGGICQH